MYLDHNATTTVRPEAVDAVCAVLSATGNPSSVHGPGRAARAVMEDAREAVAALVGATPAQVVFTSGGTEAANQVFHAVPAGPRLVSAVEHSCVLAPAPDAEKIPVTGDGVIDLDWLERRLAQTPRPAVVAVMLANNETGVIQPVAEAARLARAAGVFSFCDAVQGVGKVAVELGALGVDALSLSAHKFGGPQGVGALVVRDAAQMRPLLVGGGQERGKRGGTQNLPGIAGLGAAARAVRDAGAEQERIAALRNRLEAGIRAAAPQAVIWGTAVARLPNTTCVALPGVDQQRQLMALDLAGVAVSAGSACSSGKVTASHVLSAMGAAPDLAGATVRISLGWPSTEADVDRFLDAWTPLARRTAS